MSTASQSAVADRSVDDAGLSPTNGSALDEDPEIVALLKRHRIPERPGTGTITQRFPTPIPITKSFLVEAYTGIGLATGQIEQLTGQPAGRVRQMRHQLAVPVRTGGYSPGFGASVEPRRDRHADQCSLEVPSRECQRWNVRDDEGRCQVSDTRPLGRSELRVPRLGVGTMTWGDPSGMRRINPAKLAYGGAQSAQEEDRAFQTSMAAGVTLFDTAAMYSYGASERRLGELAHGTSALIATKFPPGMRATAQDMPQALERSLARLGRPSVDLYQHHFPAKRVDIPRLMGLIADAVAAGTVKAVGVSNYSAEQMRIAHAALAERGVPLASNQVQYSLLHRLPETNGVLDTCRELGVTLIAYQPLASGALTGKYLAGTRPHGFRRFMPFFRKSQRQSVSAVVTLLGKIGENHGTGATQVAIRWLIENDSVLPIPGAKNGAQATANAQALTISLSADEVEALDRATLDWRV